MRILFSWLATENDFADEQTVHLHGPTLSLHRHHFDKKFDIHLLFSTSNTAHKRHLFMNELHKHFPQHDVRNIEFEMDAFADMLDIKDRIAPELLKYEGDELNIFISVGTTTMKFAWLLCHLSMGLNTRLLQLLKPENSRDGLNSELLTLGKVPNNLPISLVRHKEDWNKSREPFLPESLRRVYEAAELIAQADNVPVLILGESGTGKELLARHIHHNSIRRKKLMLAFNSSAFTDEILESRLFGHEAGSFTGANKAQKGIFEQAHGSTVFLDEIGDISTKLQQSLLRFMESGQVIPVGGQVRQVDTRVIVATHHNLKQRIEDHTFRHDLYFRLNVAPLELPALRHYNKNDFVAMVEHLSAKQQTRLGKNYRLRFSDTALQQLFGYEFPGNIRELENLVTRLYISQGEELIAQVPENYFAFPQQHNDSLMQARLNHAKRIVALCGGNKRLAANRLHISPKTLYNILDKETD